MEDCAAGQPVLVTAEMVMGFALIGGRCRRERLWFGSGGCLGRSRYHETGEALMLMLLPVWAGWR